MKRCGLLALMFALTCAKLAAQDFPKLETVEPDSGKMGDLAEAKGSHLDKSKVAEFYITDGKNDIRVVITEQSDTSIKFKVPKAAAARYHLMILTANRASMIEQPVIFTVQ